MNSILFICLFIFFMTSINLKVGHGQYNVLNYGAKGDGQTDDSEAFMKTWEDFCGATEEMPLLIVPGNKFLLLQQLTFLGPCRSNAPIIKIVGTITIGGCLETWLVISQVTGLTYGGLASQALWTNKSQLSAQVNDECQEAPALVIDYCDKIILHDLTNNGLGVKVHRSQQVVLRNHIILSPKRADAGIHIENSTDVNIYNSSIDTVDDCIVIKGGSYFININQISCKSLGYGGISVGDLGYNGQEDIVENIEVWDCNFHNAGMKIKTWPGGTGYARAISFHHNTLDQSKDPIFIDQHYNGSIEQRQAVKVSDVTFSDIRGTSVDERAIILDCAEVACEDIKLNQINITSIDPNKPASAICNHAYGTSDDTEPPTSSCLNPLI